MISFHRTAPDQGFTKDGARHYGYGFEVADVDSTFRVASCARKFVWSPIVWREGRRHQDSFYSASWCVLDFDGPDEDGDALTLEDAKQKWSDCQHFIGTTKSHQLEKKGKPPADRFRVAIRFERPITDLRTYRWNMWRLLQDLPCDKSCRDGARFFYPCKEIVQIIDCGEYYPMKVLTDIPKEFDRPLSHAAYRRAGLVPPWTDQALRTVIPVGERNTTVYRMAKDLFKAGFDEASIMELIFKSKTYEAVTWTPSLEREVHYAVVSGIKKASVELAFLNEPEPSKLITKP